MRRTITVLFALFATAVAFGGANAAEPPPPTYPVDNVVNATQNTQRSLADQEIGRYQFDAGMYGVVRRVGQRYPEHYLTGGVAVRRELQAAIDAGTHMRPSIPYTHWGDAGHPALMPDWDHDGLFGDAGGYAIADRGDFDADTDGVMDTAYYRIPCYTPDDDYQIHHVYASGGCDVTDAGAEPYAIGVATELKIIDARGLLLDATLWLPPEAFAGSGCPAYGSAAYADAAAWKSCVSPANLTAAHDFPGLVFANGLASRQEHYHWFSERMAHEGYIVLTYDPAGQGESEGTFGDTLGMTEQQRADQQFAGTVRDLQDVMHWFVGDAILRAPDRGVRLVDRADPAANSPNPAADLIDTGRIGLAGNSMGAIATLRYLEYLGEPGGLGADGRPLPMVKAAVSMSGARSTHAVVPIQFQTTDGDGSPLLILPKVAGVNLGYQDQGIGYELIKERYDQLRTTSEQGALSLVVFESGAHTDHVDVPEVPRTFWGNALAADYAADWLNCYVLGDNAACAGAASVRPHLSRIYASEQDPDGPAGPSPSRCIRVPDAWALNQTPQAMMRGASGSPVYDCEP